MHDYIRKSHALAHMLYLASNIFMHVNKYKCRYSITCREKEQDRLNIMGWRGVDADNNNEFWKRI